MYPFSLKDKSMMEDKLKFVFRPFISALIGLVVGYSFLHWVVVIKFGLLQPKDKVVELVVPALLSILLVIFYIYPRVKVLRLRDHFFYAVVAWVGLVIPTAIAQDYMVTVTGTLTELTSVREMDRHKPTRFYKLRSYHPDKEISPSYATYDVSGRNSEDFNMHLYVVCPIRETPNVSYDDTPSVWLGEHYKERISNRMKHEKKEKAYTLFVEQGRIKFAETVTSFSVYFERVDSRSKYHDGFMKAISLYPGAVSDPIILMRMSESLYSKNESNKQRLLIALLIVTVLWFLMSAIPKIDPNELKRVKAGKPDMDARREWHEWRTLVLPHKGFFVTPILVYINVGVFLLMTVLGHGFIYVSPQVLLDWGACYAPMVMEGQWWRLLTAIFLHGGVAHLCANMVWLVLVGIDLEHKMSRMMYLLIYFLSGLLGSLTSILWNGEAIGVGASGAIMGLFGAFIALLITGVYPKGFVKSLLINAGVFVGMNLLMGLAGGIDNAAHIGGLLCGFVLGIGCSPFLKRAHHR